VGRRHSELWAHLAGEGTMIEPHDVAGLRLVTLYRFIT
jgi:hypothetical protein